MSIALVTIQTHSFMASRSVYSVIRKVLYSDPTIESISSSAVFHMFILVPCPALVLILYATSLYELLTQHISLRKQIAIKIIFAETFQE